MKRLFGFLALIFLVAGCGAKPTSPGSLLGIYDLQQAQFPQGTSTVVLKPPDATGRVILQEDGSYSFILIFAQGKFPFGTGFAGNGAYKATNTTLNLTNSDGPAFKIDKFLPGDRHIEMTANLHGVDVKMVFLGIVSG